MNVEIRISPKFKKEAKRLIKKYPSLKQELSELVNELREKPDSGTPLGQNCYKIRMAVKSKNKGKSGGFRIITYLIATLQLINRGDIVYLAMIYDKSERDTISPKDLSRIISEIQE